MQWGVQISLSDINDKARIMGGGASYIYIYVYVTTACSEARRAKLYVSFYYELMLSWNEEGRRRPAPTPPLHIVGVKITVFSYLHLPSDNVKHDNL